MKNRSIAFLLLVSVFCSAVMAKNEVTIPRGKERPVILMNNTTNVTTKNLVLPMTEAQGIKKTDYK